MKVWLVFTAILIAVNALSHHEQWIGFKNEYGRNYKSAREETFRFGIFQDNLRKIEDHNKKYDQGDETYMMGLNQFADLTQEEFEKMYTMPDFHPDQTNIVYHANFDSAAAESVDWREKGAVMEVQNQGSCGGCYAFSAGGALEGQNAIKHKLQIVVSYQELLDCSGSYGTHGCKGGWMNNAFYYVRDHGIASSKDYEYHAVQEVCKNSTMPRISLKVSGYGTVDARMNAVRQAVEHIGPLSITLNHKPIMFYSKGILNPKNCPENTTHAVLIVGFGTDNEIDYWIMKNSWGTKWGENGYFRIIRNEENPCGIYSHVMYPIVE